MALIVQKYGGTSVGNPDRIKNVAARVAKYRAQGDQVVVVVSAMSGVTDGLIKLAKDNFSVILQGVSRFEVSTFDGANPVVGAIVKLVLSRFLPDGARRLAHERRARPAARDLRHRAPHVHVDDPGHDFD